MRRNIFTDIFLLTVSALMMLSCGKDNKQNQNLQAEIKSLNLTTGDITLCGSGLDKFGSVQFSLSCSEKVRENFDLAIALLHSFEYTEAEKVFADVLSDDPQCVMAYWGVAMANFHPLWAAPSQDELAKGSKAIAVARSLVQDKSTRESYYIEAIAAIYDDWQQLDHRTRVQKYEQASQSIFEKYQDDKEAAIFYALALNAAADPADKTFRKQKEASRILNKIFEEEPGHPGIAHYLIHTHDYPELAELGLDAARKYASIATASAHAQHMPSHIFTRLGLWDEAIQSNHNSVSAAKCYAENAGMKGHWDEELHGLDYLTYAYLQQSRDKEAEEQLKYLTTIDEVSPVNFKVAYCYAAMPARYALERKDWNQAASLELKPANFSWNKFPWERANISFARLLGSVHIKDIAAARKDLDELKSIHKTLMELNESYKANLVLIQVKTGEAWIQMGEGKHAEAVSLMTEAADMEDRTAKHPVTPGEVIPARELLADMYFGLGDWKNAFKAYQQDLATHPKRFNGVLGAALSAEKAGLKTEASRFYNELKEIAGEHANSRKHVVLATIQ